MEKMFNKKMFSEFVVQNDPFSKAVLLLFGPRSHGIPLVFRSFNFAMSLCHYVAMACPWGPVEIPDCPAVEQSLPGEFGLMKNGGMMVQIFLK